MWEGMFQVEAEDMDMVEAVRERARKRRENKVKKQRKLDRENSMGLHLLFGGGGENYSFVCFVCLFIYLFIYLFVCLFVFGRVFAFRGNIVVIYFCFWTVGRKMLLMVLSLGLHLLSL